MQHFLVVFVILVSSVYAFDEYITFGHVSVYPEQNENNTPKELLDGILFWVNHTNANGGIKQGNKTYGVELRVVNATENSESVMAAHRELLTNTSVKFLFGLIRSDLFAPVKGALIDPNKIITMAYHATTGLYQSSNYMFSTQTPTERMAASFVPLLQINRVKTIVMVQTEFFFSRLLCGSLSALATEAGMKVLYTSTIQQISGEDQSLLYERPDVLQNYTAALDEAMSFGADAFAVCNNGLFVEPLPFMLKTMKEKNYHAKAVITPVMYAGRWPNLIKDDTDNVLEYLISSVIWDRRFVKATGDWVGSAGNFANLFESQFGYEPSWWSAMSASNGIVLQRAIEKSISMDPDVIARNIELSTLESFYGRTAFNPDHTQLIESTPVQFVNKTVHLVGPSLGFNLSDFVYPMPMWNDRQVTQEFGDATIEWVFTGILIFAAIISVFLIFAVVIMRSHKLIKASSPTFMIGILLGSILVYASVIFMAPGIIGAWSCNLAVWLYGLGFSLLFGSLFAKSWRVWQLYANKAVVIVRISDKMVGFVLMLILATELVFLILMTSIGKIEKNLEIKTVYYNSNNYYTCRPNTAWIVFAAMNMVYLVALLGYGGYLAFRLRNIPYAIYNESSVIGFSIYNTMVWHILLVVLVITMMIKSQDIDRYLFWGLICVAALLEAGTIGNINDISQFFLGSQQKFAEQVFFVFQRGF